MISEGTAYTVARMMQGAVDKGTAAGMRARVGAEEMGGKTGTTNDNADAWFIGYTPQLLMGAWVGFDDRFIRNEGDGSRMARPICEYFLGKVLSDPKSGIDRGARFFKPSDLSLHQGAADIQISETDPLPGAAGENNGSVTEEDYEEQAPKEDPSAPVRKDTNNTRQPARKEGN